MKAVYAYLLRLFMFIRVFHFFKKFSDFFQEYTPVVVWYEDVKNAKKRNFLSKISEWSAILRIFGPLLGPQKLSQNMALYTSKNVSLEKKAFCTIFILARFTPKKPVKMTLFGQILVFCWFYGHKSG